jgi:predicted DNA binding CopG/RHH family protein
MKKEYDLSKLKGRKNPYTKYLKKQISIRIDIETIEYFKKLSEESGMPYQNLINLYLSDCVKQHKKIVFNFK